MFLEKILIEKRREVEARKEQCPIQRLDRDALQMRGRFRGALRKPGLSVIAEFKRKSPSAGLIRKHADPVQIASAYEQNGADAVSVLTDFQFFGGSLEDLCAVKQAVRLPVLRKEFIIDNYQIIESVRSGADAVLLIVKLLDDDTLERFLRISREFGLEPLVEVHDAADLDRALDAGAEIIGVNNRNLDTLQVTLRTSINLIRLIPQDRIKVSESGIRSREDAALLEQAGFDAVLVGGTLMEADDPGYALCELKSAPVCRKEYRRA